MTRTYFDKNGNKATVEADATSLTHSIKLNFRQATLNGSVWIGRTLDTINRDLKFVEAEKTFTFHKGFEKDMKAFNNLVKSIELEQESFLKLFGL